VVESHPDKLEVVSLAAGENTGRFVEQVVRFRPRAIAMASPEALGDVERALSVQGRRDLTLAGSGSEGMIAVATHPDVDIVLCASSGTAALESVLAAIAARKTIALANKEVLVMAGALVVEAAARYGVLILPVDSEHNAIHQCLHGRDLREVRRIILTASGGPFRDRSADALAGVSPADALRHPTWQMGRKITVDSATMMNKGLEVIEARWLFGVPAASIDVVVHPQSVVHSLVELRDGSVIAQLGVTDMRLPIQYAFSYPDRWHTPLPPLDLAARGRLDFEPPDERRFPCLRLAYRALEEERSLPVVLNAANEIAVAAFLDGLLPFTGISALIERALDHHERSNFQPIRTLDDVRALDQWARGFAWELVQSKVTR
jgi:1-deoxy-D-xylulose-5-phosphate reductoisomerase